MRLIARFRCNELRSREWKEERERTRRICEEGEEDKQQVLTECHTTKEDIRRAGRHADNVQNNGRESKRRKGSGEVQ